MRYFDRAELARRYESSRPQVHAGVLAELAAKEGVNRVERALDVACGTGHSTTALSSVAWEFYGCEISPTMIAARDRHPPLRLVQCPAETLPFPSASFDLLTVSMAFHWLDQTAFLDEAARVLRPSGRLWIYNLMFPGELLGDPEFSTWHRDSYLGRFPAPTRHGETLANLLESRSYPFQLSGESWLRFEVEFDAIGLRNYLTTQSNIEAAIRRGTELASIDRWLEVEICRFFAGKGGRRFAYVGHALTALANGS